MLPAAVLGFIGRKYGNMPIQVQEYPIKSAVRFEAAVAAGPPVSYTIDQRARVAFSYGIGQDMAPAGRPGVLATQADTTLQNAGQTRDQADVFIYGISCFLNSQSEPLLTKDVWRETDLIIATNSDTQTPMGGFDQWPSPGGLFGAGMSAIAEPALDEFGGFDGGPGAPIFAQSNGNPTAGSFRLLENPIFWAGLSSGPDSNLQVICTPRRTITRTAALVRPAGVAGATYDGAPAPYTPPTSAFVDVMVVLHAATVKRRGVNAG